MAQSFDLRQFSFINHPNIVFPAIATPLAFAALSPTPSFIPLTILVSTLLVYTRIVIFRPHAPRAIFATIFGVSLASTLSHLSPSLTALSSTASSIFSLWILSSVSSAVAIFVVIGSDRLSLDTPWPKVTFFPAIWATTWQIISHASPVGLLVTWSPSTGIASYEWMRPVFGTWGINWVVGAWAIFIAEVVGAWFIGPVETFEPQGPLIPSLVSSEEPQRKRHTSLLKRTHTLLLGAALLVLIGPSTSLVTPILPWDASSTPLHVGCVLPHPSSPGDGRSPLDRFIEESKQHNGVRLLLWPEGVLRFENVAQREEALNRVRNEVKGPFIGVTFTESVPPDEWDHSREGKWRNGLALVGPDGVVLEYYKRNLVPIAESFPLTQSKKDPEIYELELHRTNKNRQWTPVPPYDRTIPITAAICLDFSSPTIFTSLASRPALILAPAQTWHRDVSMAMWEQARARAEEAGGTVLFCDGGAQGASGIAGQGIHEPVQFGSGTWTRTIGVEWPFNQRRTLYMWGGDFLEGVIVWLLVGMGWATNGFVLRGTHDEARHSREATSFPRLREFLRKARAYIRRPAHAQAERQPLLL